MPVASYTSWRLRSEEAGAANELLSLNGSYIPFPKTKAEREQSGDPRLSIEERYESLEDYLEILEAQCREYEKAGYLLSEDVPHILETQRKRVADLFEPAKAL